MRYYPLIQSAPFIFLLALKDNAQQLLNIQINNIKVNFSSLLVKKIIIILGLINILFISSSSTAYQIYRSQTYLNFVETIKDKDPLKINFEAGFITDMS